MRWKVAFVVACVSPVTGCHIAQNAARTISHEPIQYFDEVHIAANLKKDAKIAWAEVNRQYPRRRFCDDFQNGFIDGYTDYLNNGGAAQLPAMPPVKYRRSKYLNPEGHEIVKQYFLGFKYGMDVAIATGCRPFLTVPILMPEPQPAGNPNITVLPAPPDIDAPMPVPLSPPKPVVPGVGSGSPPPVSNPPMPIPAAPPPILEKPKPGTIPVPKLDPPSPGLNPKNDVPKGMINIPPGVGNLSSSISTPVPPTVPMSPGVNLPIPEPTPPIQPMCGQEVKSFKPGPIYDLPAPRPVQFDLPVKK